MIKGKKAESVESFQFNIDDSGLGDGKNTKPKKGHLGKKDATNKLKKKVSFSDDADLKNKKSEKKSPDDKKMKIKKKKKLLDKADKTPKVKSFNTKPSEGKPFLKNPAFKRKTEEGGETDPKKPKLHEMKKKDRKNFRKKIQNTEYDLSVKVKMIGEALRPGKATLDKKAKLMKELMDLSKGKLKELIFAHDTTRVFEWVVMLGSKEQKEYLFNELRDIIIDVAKSKYAKHILLKFFKYGTKEQKDHILKCFYGKTVKLLMHKEAAAVIETAYNDYANATQRSLIIREFYGPSFSLLQDEETKNLDEYLKKNAVQTEAVLKNLKEALSRIFEKALHHHSIVHSILHSYLTHTNEISRQEMIAEVAQFVVEMVHTKDGSRVAMSCVWNGTTKERKTIVKSLKGHVLKIATDPIGHMVLMCILDSVDDTKLINKVILSELFADSLAVSKDQHARKILFHILHPRETKFAHPDVISILKKGDGNPNSKKEASVRSSEILAYSLPPLIKLVSEHASELIKENSTCQVLEAILTHPTGDLIVACKAVAALLKEPYCPVKGENLPLIERPASHILLKKAIMNDSENKNKKAFFSEILIYEIPEDVFKSWIHCNRGAFLLLKLLQTGIESVVQRVKEELFGLHKALAKKEYVGADLLLKELKGSSS